MQLVPRGAEPRPDSVICLDSISHLTSSRLTAASYLCNALPRAATLAADRLRLDSKLPGLQGDRPLK